MKCMIMHRGSEPVNPVAVLRLLRYSSWSNTHATAPRAPSVSLQFRVRLALPRKLRYGSRTENAAQQRTSDR